MLLAMGAASAALDALTSLVSPKPSSSTATTGFSQTTATPFDSTAATATGGPTPMSGYAGSSQSGCLSPATMSALLAAQGQSSAASPPMGQSDALKNLFSQLDADGDGNISKSEFENALGAGGTNVAQADDVFSKMDKNGDGSVSLDEMSSSLKGAGGRHHHHHAAPAGGSGGAGGGGSSTDALLQALQGASSTSVTNSDGSTTTSMTYADGSKVTMTSPAAASTSTSAASSYNFVEQAIQRQAQALSASAASSLSI